MVATETILCSTQGNVAASTATPLLNPMTGEPAVLPTGAVVKTIHIYRDGDNSVTGGCAMQLGVVGALAKYITVSEGLNTTDLNNGHLISKSLSIDKGLDDTAELRLCINNALTTGSIVFEITYCVYA